ncbi:CheR family methyltransferase [Desulfococcaceae bacterium HSG9]|nr:CheR family methyltransferase [Desulfococcaceae bacterium HSG9]
MQTMQEKSFDDLVERFLGMRLPRQMANAVSLSELPPYAQGFTMRMLALMKRSGYSVTEFNPALIRWLSASIPSMLPDAWGGRIPPITLPNRHSKLDVYVSNRNMAVGNEPHIFVDMGCGFPPVTAADTARKFPDWQIYGVDRSFADFVLYDKDGHYACFDQKGVFQYFQALMNLSGRALYADPEATGKRFNKFFADLFPLLQDTDGTASETVEKDGNKLIHNHIRDFETDNLTFVKSDIAELKLPPAKVIRCMNVLLYFQPEIRKTMLLQAGELLDDDGILIAGTNGLGIQARYAVYQKGADGLFPSEFAFSLDNIGHIAFMPWLTICENDPEAILLADLAGTIRADRPFWPEFSSRIDELLQEHEICERRSDGFLHFQRDNMPPDEYLKINALLWRQIEDEGYLDRAAAILERAGYETWINSAGDIAVRPLANSLPIADECDELKC